MIAGIYCWSKLLKTRSTFNSSVFNIYLHEFGEYHSNGPTLFSGMDSWTSWTHGPAGFTMIDVRKRAIVKYKLYNDDSNKHPSTTGLTQNFQLQ